MPGARLRITTLRAAEGPGIELLEYRTPRDGRPIPDDLKANDIAHWQVRLIVANVSAARRVAEVGTGALVSRGEITLPDAQLGFPRGVLLRDPDGHSVELVERPQ